jgi:hypothetical protein
MDWLNPVEWFAWIYGKFFQGHIIAGGIVMTGLCAVLGFVLWIRGVDKYREEHPAKAEVANPDPKQQTVAATNTASQSVTVTQPISTQGVPATAASTLIPKQRKTTAPKAAITETPTEQRPAGADMEALQSVMSGHRAPDPPPYSGKTGGRSIHDNVFNGPLSPRPNKLEVEGPGTEFAHNTIRNMDATVSNGAHADNNLLEGRTPTTQITQYNSGGVNIGQVSGGTVNIQHPAKRQVSANVEQLKTILSDLHSSVGFGAILAAPDAYEYATALRSAFADAGVKVSPSVHALTPGPLLYGVEVWCRCEWLPSEKGLIKLPDNSQEEIVVRALRAVGVEGITLNRDSSMPTDNIFVAVSFDPHHAPSAAQ